MTGVVIIKTRTGLSIKKYITARHHRSITIAVGNETITAVDPLPEDLDAIQSAHQIDKSQASVGYLQQ